MREKGEIVSVLKEGRKGGGRILIQTESVHNISITAKMYKILIILVSKPDAIQWCSLLSIFLCWANNWAEMS